MASRYGEFVLLVAMLLVATVTVAVAIGTAAPEDGGPEDVQYTVEAQLFVNDTDNRTVVSYANLTDVQQEEFERARTATITSEARPQLIEYAGYPYLIEYEGREYELVIFVYD